MALIKQDLLELLIPQITNRNNQQQSSVIYGSLDFDPLVGPINGFYYNGAVCTFPGCYIKEVITNSTDYWLLGVAPIIGEDNNTIAVCMCDTGLTTYYIYHIENVSTATATQAVILGYGPIKEPITTVSQLGHQFRIAKIDTHAYVFTVGNYLYGLRGETSMTVEHGGTKYYCIKSHFADKATTEPGVGSSWTTYWTSVGAADGSDPAWEENANYIYRFSVFDLKYSSGNNIINVRSVIPFNDFVVYNSKDRMEWSTVTNYYKFDGEFNDAGSWVTDITKLNDTFLVNTNADLQVWYYDKVTPFSKSIGRESSTKLIPGTIAKYDLDNAIAVAYTGELVQVNSNGVTVLDDSFVGELIKKEKLYYPTYTNNVPTAENTVGNVVTIFAKKYYLLASQAVGEIPTSYLFDIESRRWSRFQHDHTDGSHLTPYFIYGGTLGLPYESIFVARTYNTKEVHDVYNPPKIYFAQLYRDAGAQNYLADTAEYESKRFSVVFPQLTYGTAQRKVTSKLVVRARLQYPYGLFAADVPDLYVRWRKDDGSFSTSRKMQLKRVPTNATGTHTLETFEFVLHNLGSWYTRQYELYTSTEVPLTITQVIEYVEVPDDY